MRLIDAEALVNALSEARDFSPTLCGRPIIEVSDIIQMIEDAPSIDAEPVRRCKDCQYCMKPGNPPEAWDGSWDYSFVCTAWETDFYAPKYTPDTYFCGDFKRREE